MTSTQTDTILTTVDVRTDPERRPVTDQPDQPAVPSRTHIPALDGVRGIAILMVMAFHLVEGDGGSSYAARFVLGVVHTGWAGVDLFFVLSGFLITGILLKDLGSEGYFRNFYMRRTLRIFPLYYGVLAVIFLILPLFGVFSTPALQRLQDDQLWFWLYGTNFYAIHQGDHVVADWLWLHHLWSLSVEEHFYLIWPAVVWFFGKGRSLVLLCLVCLLVLPLTRLTAVHWGVSADAISCLTWFRFDSLVAGALLAALMTFSDKARVTRVARSSVVLGTVSTVSLVVLGIAYDGLVTDPYIRAISFTLLAVASAGLIAAAATATAGSVLSVILSNRVLRLLGKWSYGLYIYQMLLQPFTQQWLSTSAIQQVIPSKAVAGLLHLFLTILVVVAVGGLSWNLYEKHFLKLKRFFVPKRVETGQPVRPNLRNA